MEEISCYKRYKDSGVKWFSKIPEHWEVKRFGYLFSFSRGLSITKQSLKDEGIPCVNYGEIHSKYGFEVNPEIHPLKCVEEEYLSESPKSLLSKGDFVYADTSEDIEGSGNFTCLNSDIPTFAGYHTIIARHDNVNNYRYLAYFFDSIEYRNQIRSLVSGIKVFSITQAILKKTKLLLPPKKEQDAIAAYLDVKTTEIDELIADKLELLNLYNEEKNAVINQAITKGINSKAPMKKSGVNWLGKIPENWTIKKLRYLFDIEKRIAGRLGFDVLSITQKGIKVKNIESKDGQISSDYSKYQMVYKGDFAMNHMDLLTGFVDISKYDGVTSPDYRVFSLKDKNLCSTYFLYLFQLGYWRKIFYAFGRGAAHFGRWRFPTEQFKEFSFPFPPISEQKKIVNYIKSEIDRIDTKKAKTEKLIELLTEYRTALISEVVTGKIKITE